MLRVYLCEDNEKQRDVFRIFIKETIAAEKLDMELYLVTENPYILLNSVKEDPKISLYFIDVDLGEDKNGIKFAEQIREYDPNGFIVFITTHAEMCYLTFKYKVEAMDYIIKDNYSSINQNIKKCILAANKKYLNKAKEENKKFVIKSDDRVIKIDYKDILFFETTEIKHKVRLYSVNRQVEFYSQMKEIEEKLDDRFIRCHRAFIINKDKVKEVDKSNRLIHMEDGQTCFLATRAFKYFK
ncbi:two component transcriptional regulator, LytTR family [Clostridium cavendishii DSM 21758]|uniref:Stage 0 sporulation protein A homolog n=1 Tax=Clostridium cavendishii DSM 21758 TaxID=1121302 RepID=A0A1M6J6Z9_9CLOT|nr:LytTR family DNA-binding domain-containing protein [Clostridium cavendishii]SHJ42387.1 two component transcriptional regulator, LytTR family [Clostridium cavendishii DSM 21758]